MVFATQRSQRRSSIRAFDHVAMHWVDKLDWIALSWAIHVAIPHIRFNRLHLHLILEVSARTLHRGKVELARSADDSIVLACRIWDYYALSMRGRCAFPNWLVDGVEA